MIPIFEIEINEDEFEEGLQAVSFVQDPAIQEHFVYFNEQKEHLYLQEDKRIVVSPLIIPNQLIYRLTESGEPYYIRWSKDVIRKVATKFMLEQKQNVVTIEHPMIDNPSLSYEDCSINDVYMLRMWIVEDEATDPINTLFGYKNLPNGTLCCMYKVHSQNLWKKIKMGEVRGLSLEAVCNLKRINQKKENTMSLFEKITTFLNDISLDIKELEDAKRKDVADSGEVTFRFLVDSETNDYIIIDKSGFARNAKTRELLQKGEYALENGDKLIVGENGMFETTIKKPLLHEELPIEETDPNVMVESAVKVNESTETETITAVETEVETNVNEPNIEEPSENQEIKEEVIENGSNDDVKEEEIQDEIKNEVATVEVASEDIIASLNSKIAALEGQINDYKSRIEGFEASTPSTSPIGAVVKNGNMEKMPSNSINADDLVSLLNRYKR